MFKHLLLMGLVIGITEHASADPIPKPTLRGATIKVVPYVEPTNGTFKGFGVDLIQKISEKAGFDYELYLTEDGSYGRIVDGKMNGMIGEVESKKADFAIADLTVTDTRAAHVQFTEPFYTSQLMAIVQKKDAEGLATLGDLVNRNEESARADPPRPQVSFAVINYGSTRQKLSEIDDPVAKSIHASIEANKDKSLVRTSMQGLDRVNAGGFAFVGESHFGQYITGKNCNLTMLPDNRSLFSRDYAIALQKDSPYLEQFNAAIRELKADGTIEQLEKKYWIDKCK